MKEFLQRFGSRVLGVLSGWDRLRFRGTKRLLAHAGGMFDFLWQCQILLKDFKTYVQDTTATLRRGVEEQAQQLGCPVTYLDNSKTDKEEEALRQAALTGAGEGLVAVLSCVERCRSYGVHRNRQSQELELRLGEKKCLHYYHYFRDPQLGLVHTRLQTWFPFTIQICLNGREWLSRQMEQAQLGYQRRDNCFVDLEDIAASQALMDQQSQTDWPKLLEGLAQRSNPAHDQIFGSCPVPYYWSADESEWATDLMFRSPAALAEVTPDFYRHGLETLKSKDVLVFLGRKVTAADKIFGNFRGAVTTSLKERPEGKRIGHMLNRNWIKMYDKQGSVLRVETVINDAHDMKVFRPKEGDENGPKAWRYMRKGIADLHRRAEVSHKANERYVASLATVAETTPLGKLTHALCQPVTWKGKRARALNPLGEEDAKLLAAIARGEFLINGFRNRELQPLLFTHEAKTPAEKRCRSAAVTRKLRLLRAHGLIRKVPKSHRYTLTKKGQTTITALLAARQADTTKLTKSA